jgi:histidinol-phosphatase (PHP family)
MAAACQRAVELGITTIAVTDHADFTPWELTPQLADQVPERLRRYVRRPASLVPPRFDLRTYRNRLDDCRERFPGLRILAGVELSEPHLFPAESRELLRAGAFDLVVVAVHSLGESGRYRHAPWLFGEMPAAAVVRDYLANVRRMLTDFTDGNGITVLGHIDYPVRNWPAGAGGYAVADFEADYRAVLAILARRGGALEVNARVPLPAAVIGWWRDEGGRLLTLGSDAHDGASVGRGLAGLAEMVASMGFTPCDDGSGLWAYR